METKLKVDAVEQNLDMLLFNEANCFLPKMKPSTTAKQVCGHQAPLTSSHLCLFVFQGFVSDLRAAEPSAVVPLSAEPLHEAQAFGHQIQFVLREQHVGGHLDV